MFCAPILSKTTQITTQSHVLIMCPSCATNLSSASKLFSAMSQMHDVCYICYAQHCLCATCSAHVPTPNTAPRFAHIMANNVHIATSTQPCLCTRMHTNIKNGHAMMPPPSIHMRTISHQGIHCPRTCHYQCPRHQGMSCLHNCHLLATSCH